MIVVTFVYLEVENNYKITQQSHFTSFLRNGSFQNFLTRTHHAQVNHTVTITPQYNWHNIFPNIMNVTFYSS